MTDSQPDSSRIMHPWPVARRGLALAGGGMRVAYQAGAMLALEEAGLHFDCIDGASGGTINLAMHLSGLSPRDMCERWRTLEVQHFAALLTLEDYLKPGGIAAFGGAQGVRDRVFPHLGIDIERIRQATAVEGTFNVCNYTDKVNEVISHRDLSLDLLVAGVSLPMFMPAIPWRGKTYVDSVWIRDTNLTELVRRGVDEIWLIWCIGNIDEYHPGTLEQYVHMIEICANAALFADLAAIEQYNQEIVGNGVGKYGQKKPIVVHVVKPSHALPLDPEYFLGHINADTLISMGYSDACLAVRQWQPQGIALEPGVTKMQSAERGASFRENFRGPIAVSTAAPGDNIVQAGEACLRFTVRINNLDTFIGDSAHRAEVYGSCDLPGVGEHLALSGGVFEIVLGEKSARRFEFSADMVCKGRGYRLRAAKVLRDDRGFDALNDLSCVEFELLARHANGDLSSSSPIASGKLQLDGTVADWITTIHPLGVQGLRERGDVFAELVKFQVGQAFATYLIGKKPWWRFW